MSSERARFLLVGALSLTFASCSARARVAHPQFADGGMLRDSTPVPAGSLARLKGIFGVSAGERFGVEIAVSSVRDTVSLFAEPNASYAILKGGCIDGGTRLVLEGYWRYAETTDTGLMRLFVGPPAAAAELCRGGVPDGASAPEGLVLEGQTGVAQDSPSTTAGFSFRAPLLDAKNQFTVAAHHGACRTIDDCGASEHSLESLRMVDTFGATSVEIDVHLSTDGVPFLYHDDNFDERLVNGQFCRGPVIDWSMTQIRAFCEMKYGEPIPTLDEALRTIVEETTLRSVWLDMKEGAGLQAAIDVSNKWKLIARSRNRPLVVLVGLPGSDIVDQFIAADQPKNTQCLAETTPEDVERGGCTVWAPEYTRGPQAGTVRALQAKGKHVVYWTMDDVEFIDLFLTVGRPNAILSDRPGLVFQRFQSLRSLPDPGPAIDAPVEQ